MTNTTTTMETIMAPVTTIKTISTTMATTTMATTTMATTTSTKMDDGVHKRPKNTEKPRRRRRRKEMN